MGQCQQLLKMAITEAINLAITEAINLPSFQDCCSTSHPEHLEQVRPLHSTSMLPAPRCIPGHSSTLVSKKAQQTLLLNQICTVWEVQASASLSSQQFGQDAEMQMACVNNNIQNSTRNGVVCNTYTQDSIFHVKFMRPQETVVQRVVCFG